MKEQRSLHLRVQEFADCYATNDPLKEMSIIDHEADKEEAALKWLALAALHGVNDNAKKITLTRSGDGSVTVTAEYRPSELPAPGADVGGKIFDAIRGITHIEGEKGKTRLALGIRDSSIELKVKVKEEKGREKISLKFEE